MIHLPSISPLFFLSITRTSYAAMRRNKTTFIFYTLIFICSCENISVSEGADSITAVQPLSGNQRIVSAGETFELGFFSPGNSSNSKYYIGIWYKNVATKTIVWVANRERHVSDKNSAELKILDGNLVLVDETKIPIWSTNVTSTKSNSVVATLRDDGNLVLRELSEPKTSEVFWQSFDNPTDTFLPGSKLGYDKRTKRKQILTSWKNSEDPSSGLFSLELDPIGSQYIITWNKTELYWTSGAWNGHIFSLVPEMRRNYIYNFSYIDKANESYFTYSVYSPSIISRFMLHVSGQIQQTSWSKNSKEWNLFWSVPKQQCKVYCGAYGICNHNSLSFCYCLPGFRNKSQDFSGGCVREIALPPCGNGSTSTERKEKFFVNNQLSLPDNSRSVTVMSAEECESVCLNNCSCTAYSYYGTECSVWYGAISNLQQLSENDISGRTIHVRLAASGPQFNSTKRNSKGAVIGVVVSSVAVILAIFAIIGAMIKRHRQRHRVGTTKTVEGSLVMFGYKDLRNATKNFIDKLGGGGFGSVFKGTLPDSTVIAVKKLESISQGEKQFRSEISTIGTIQHVNLVRLYGFCSEGNRKLLVYEYMENGSLNSHIFNVKESYKVLNWRTRYQIMLGIARGLSYLHEKCRDCIIHCDIKPENVLLDAKYHPKLADFGLAKLVGRDFSRVLTTLRGTRGYLAPEWVSGSAITAKADVYSYGMMLLELISGRRNSELISISGTQNSEQSGDSMAKFFPSYAASVTADGGNMLNLLDPALDGKDDEEEVLKVCKVACWCIQDKEDMRPSMGQVVQILEGVVDVNLPPMPPSLKWFVEIPKPIM